MRNEPIKVSACLEKATTMKDGSVRLTFDTQELNAERAASLFSLKNQLIWLIMCSSATEQIDLPVEPPKEFENQKSASQRLRAVLFVWFEQQGKPGGDFESFYRQKMEMVIEWIKNKLEPES